MPGFDIAFLNAELKRSGTPPTATERVVDTLVLARRKHPGGHNTLDDLCARYRVDRSRRSKHGALPIKDFRSDAVLTTNAEQ
jgi:DNA polymerase III subunit epsilon